MPTLIHQRVEQCRAGTYPKAICRVSSGWVVLGDVQIWRGYSLILPDPVVPDFNALTGGQRQTLMYEASVVGDALLEITGAVRINYEMLGNLEPALHVHIFPRFDDEADDMKTKPVWLYDWEAGPAFDLDRDQAVMGEVKAYLEAAGLAV
jgi:diadenosine tetraphosphate (Ap4A) HIT family hydrolase